MKIPPSYRRAPRRPTLFASIPPRMAPPGPPTAKADTARDHSGGGGGGVVVVVGGVVVVVEGGGGGEEEGVIMTIY